MIQPAITIDISKSESRLCRDAAKLAESEITPGAGPVTLSRGDWWDMSRWLTWRSVDLEEKVSLEDRKASGRLSERIECVIARFDVENPPAPVVAEKTVKQKSLTWE